jgi:hypothetical protein
VFADDRAFETTASDMALQRIQRTPPLTPLQSSRTDELSFMKPRAFLPHLRAATPEGPAEAGVSMSSAFGRVGVEL